MLLVVLTTVVVVVVGVGGGMEHFTMPMVTRGRMLRVLGEWEHVEGGGSCTVQHLA